MSVNNGQRSVPAEKLVEAVQPPLIQKHCLGKRSFTNVCMTAWDMSLMPA